MVQLRYLFSCHFNKKLCFIWNSYYDPIKYIVDNSNKIDEVFFITSLPPFSRKRETLFLIEYCNLFKVILCINYFR